MNRTITRDRAHRLEVARRLGHVLTPRQTADLAAYHRARALRFRTAAVTVMGLIVLAQIVGLVTR